MKKILSSLLILGLAGLGLGQDPVFSGPQAGEKLPILKVRAVFDPHAGKEIDLVALAGGKPLVLIFVHEVNRPAIGMARTLATYTKTREKDGLTTGVVLLTDDPAEGEATLKRVKGALGEAVHTVSLDGKEGPGAYGLNRKVSLTILVANQGKVSANFALIQPSLQADLPKILEAVVKVAGGKAPKVEDLVGMPVARPKNAEPDPRLRELLRPVIQKDATPEEVDKAAKEVEAYAAKNPAAKADIGRITSTIINAGKLDDYGTARAREYLKKWMKEYGVKPDDAPRRKKS